MFWSLDASKSEIQSNSKLLKWLSHLQITKNKIGALVCVSHHKTDDFGNKSKEQQVRQQELNKQRRWAHRKQTKKKQLEEGEGEGEGEEEEEEEEEEEAAAAAEEQK